MSKADAIYRILERRMNVILEDALADVEGNSRLSVDSVDSQIDTQLALFEKRSTEEEPDEHVELPETRSLSLRMIIEADEEEPAPEEPADDEPAQEEPVQEEPAEAQPDVDVPKPKIDMPAFTGRVARLIENYTKLLDVPSVIITRATKFLEENQGPEAANEFTEMLDRDHGISLEPADNEPPPPPAVGAGPG